MEYKKGEKEFRLFLDLIQGPSLIISLVAVVALVFSAGFLKLGHGSFYIMGIAEIIGLIVAGFFIATRSLDIKMAVSAGFFTGLMIGISVALFKLLWYHRMWALFNLVIEPFATALLGLVLYWITAKIYFRKKT